MRVKGMIAVLAVAACIAPARADHCNQVSFYSGYRGTAPLISYSTDWVGCSNDHENLDYILPGTSYGVVFAREARPPIEGAILDGELIGSRLELGGVTTLLSFTRGTGGQGRPADFWFSPNIDYPVERSVDRAFVAFITICYAEDECYERTYRTAAA